MSTKVERKTNPVLQDVIRKCEEAGRKHDAAVWTDVAELLKKANRDQVTVNISHIERHADDGETVVVPGKVMGAGYLNKDVTVAALEFTQSAKEAVHKSGTVEYIEDLVDENPEGEGLQVLG